MCSTGMPKSLLEKLHGTDDSAGTWCCPHCGAALAVDRSAWSDECWCPACTPDTEGAMRFLDFTEIVRCPS